MKSYYTRSLCSKCYQEIPATIEYRDDGAAYITKHCPIHGYEEYMVERSWKFWEDSQSPAPLNSTKEKYDNIFIIEATDRCNLMCKHCYHLPDNKIQDKPIDFILSKILSAPTPVVTLMGAEPTMREDLFEIIEKSSPHKMIGIYTNAIKLADPAYVTALEAAGLYTVSISVHNPNYHKESLWEKVVAGVNNIVKTKKIDIGQISFTVENIEEVRYAVEKMLWFKEHNRVPYNFCIRSAAEIGTSIDGEEVFASEIAGWLEQVAIEKNIKFERDLNEASNPYHVLYQLDGLRVQVIHWAGVKNVDLSWMNMGPYAEFVPLTFGTLHLQIILREGYKKGWWQGKRLM